MVCVYERGPPAADGGLLREGKHDRVPGGHQEGYEGVHGQITARLFPGKVQRARTKLGQLYRSGRLDFPGIGKKTTYIKGLFNTREATTQDPNIAS